MNFLRSLIFYIIFYLWTFSFFVFFSQVRFFSDNFIVSLSNFWSRSVIYICKKILKIDYEIKGKENIPKKGPFLITSNHQSAWETFFFTAIFKGSVFILGTHTNLLYAPKESKIETTNSFARKTLP